MEIVDSIQKTDPPCITPSHLFLYDCQPLWIWYELFGDPSHKEAISNFALKLMEDGIIHEERIIQKYQVTTVAEDNREAAIQTTLSLMRNGEPLIYQGVIQSEIDGITYHGRPDILQKVDGTSNLGNWTYLPLDIKSSSSVKPLQRYQLIIYGWILDALLDTKTSQGAIINSEGNHLPVDLTSKKDQEKTAAMCSAIAEIMTGKRPPYTVTSKAKNSPWFKEMLREAIEQQDISLLYKLNGKAVTGLREFGISTLDQFLKTNLQTLPKIPHAPSATLERAQLQAESLIQNKIIWLSQPNLGKDTPLKLFFDIEGSPWQKVEYLFGFWIVGDDAKRWASDNTHFRIFEDTPDKYFLYFIAESPDDEEKLWRDFLKWIEILSANYQVIHYADYERSHLNKLAEKYGDSSARQKFMTCMVDLEKVVQQSVIFPLHFYSIKDIAKSTFLNFKWRHEKAGGSQSVFWYDEWLETRNRTILDDIINYNEDDVRATEHLYNWLRNNNRKN